MGRREDDRRGAAADAAAGPITVHLDDIVDPDPLELAVGSAVQDRDAMIDDLAREELDTMLRAYLRDVGGEPRVELVLYVVDGSEACAAARAALMEILRRYDPRDVATVVRNLTRDPLSVEDDALIVVPTLVMHEPWRMQMPGAIDVVELERALREAGVRRRRV